MLIVLDNCEHLIDDCAALVDALLSHCPDVRVLATSTGQERWLAEITHNEGIASLFSGDPATALTHLTESHDAHKKAGNDFGIMVALIQSAAARSLLGETSHALELCEECLDISARHGDRWCAALAMWTQALLPWHWNEAERAETLAAETLTIKEAVVRDRASR